MRFNDDYMGCFGKLPERKKTQWIVIHHTCTATPRKTRSALKAKGYSTHFEIDRDGTIYRYAKLDRKCSHCCGANHKAVGVDLTHPAGADWPQAQLDAARELFEWLSAKLGIPLRLYEAFPAGFIYHRAISDTVCPQNFPGPSVFDDVADVEGESC